MRILLINQGSILKTGYGVFGKFLLEYLSKKYTVGELSCDTRTDDPRNKALPWPVWGTIPTTPEEEKIYNQNPLSPFGASIFEKVCLEFKPTHICVKPDALILTENGYKKICDIQIGDYVLTHTGRLQRVTKIMKRYTKENMYHIHYNGFAHSLTLTGNHPVFAFKNKKQTNQKKKVSEIYSGETPVFVEAKNLKVGDYVISPIPQLLNQVNQIDITDYLNNYKIVNNQICSHLDNQHLINRFINIDFDLGKIIGYLITDGCIHDGNISVTFHKEEERFVDDFLNLFKKIFNITGYKKESKKKNSIIAYINSTLLVELFSKLIGRNIKKTIPHFTLRSNDAFIAGILCGSCRGDGHYSKNTIAWTSKRRYLANTYRLLCNTLKCHATVNKYFSTTKFGNGVVYKTEAHGKYAKRLHEIIKKFQNFSFSYKEDEHVKNSYMSSNIDDKYFITKIKRIRTSEYEGIVYNLEVENDNSYVVEQACVHNCSISDPWMSGWIGRHFWKKFYNFIWMPTLDAAGLSKDWLYDFNLADKILTYQGWSNKILTEESGKLVSCGDAPYIPSLGPMDRSKIKNKLGEGIVIGTVMRNQFRKRFPEIFQAFAKLKSKHKNIKLYCHCSYPDNQGWDIPKLILKNGIADSVYFSYMCQNCRTCWPNRYQHMPFCPQCKMRSGIMCNANFSMNDEQMQEMYNLFDIYLQLHNMEGLGMPVLEAASCGTPIVATNYASLIDMLPKLNGIGVEYNLYQEITSDRLVAAPSIDDLVNKLDYIIENVDLEEWRKKTLEGYRKHYKLENTLKLWETTIKSCPGVDKWSLPPQYHNPAPWDDKLLKMKPSEFIKWCIINVLGEPEKLGTPIETKLITELDSGFRLGMKASRVSHKTIYEELSQTRNYYNYLEKIRTS